MADKTFLVDAVAQFVQGDMWRDAVSHFLESHYKRFLLADPEDPKAQGKVTGYTLEQYDSFMAFKDRVERLLEDVVGDLGCSGNDLVEAIQENLKYESALSTEKRFCIQTLLTFDDYDAFCSRIMEYAAEKEVCGVDASSAGNAELSEWALQEAIARSIMEAQALGQLDETEASWVPWAQALVEMCQGEQDTAPAETSMTAGCCGSEAKEAAGFKAEAKHGDGDEIRDGRMEALEKILIRERFKVDLLVAQRIADANAQMKKQMLNLVAEAVDQDEREVFPPENTAEDELAGLFKHIETIQERLKDVKSRCFKFENVKREQMDTVYLYLKEKVHYRQDLVSQEKEISAFIFTHIQEKDESLIPLMLEWLLLESEQLRTQNQIQESLSSTQEEGYWTQAWDDASQAFYYVNSVTKESVWDPPVAGYYDINQAFQVPGQESTLASSSTGVWGTTDAGSADTKVAAELSDTSANAWGDTSVESSREIYSGEGGMPSLDQASSRLDATFELKIEPDATEVLEMESVLERISREHDQERKRLELVFELEKARQKEELRKRKERKRREKLAKKKKKAEDDALEQPPAKEEGELSAQPLPVPMTPRAAEKTEAKSDGKEPLTIMVPGHGKLDLSHLLSDAHATRHRQLKGITPARERAMLNPETLRYLTEQMVKKQPAVLGQQVRKEIVLEELADEK
ncbi:hypothetical protein PHYBOEH_001761 [Phytophthora boehmeriae]|uniref:WW domain-containing protein n=1 Tax=Phytophthora boehmeriae TaxID=109152 RepID=A0A8T1X5T0_9STRA|nr:hypothetical protein PHYBOEH_001761 [Phytophthora boehmeriae]